MRSVGVRGVSCGVWGVGEECGCEGCHARLGEQGGVFT